MIEHRLLVRQQTVVTAVQFVTVRERRVCFQQICQGAAPVPLAMQSPLRPRRNQPIRHQHKQDPIPPRAFAAGSQRRAAEAIAAGRFAEEIVPVFIQQKKGEPLAFQIDEYPRATTSAETLARLRPAFVKENGTVTAGNASGINDGAAALVIAGEERARLMELAPMAKIIAYASGGVNPRIMGMGPVPAIERALEKAELNFADIDLFELNEAFAAQSLAVVRQLGIDESRVNVNGGAIALGHPIGASGARVLVTLLYEMRRRNARRGLAALCIGGGQGIAMIVER